MTFWLPDVAASINALLAKGHAVTLDHLRPLLNRHAAVREYASCSRCRAHCAHPRGKVHWAGTPCPDWAPIGTNERDAGQSSCLLMVWALLRRRMQEAIIAHENSHRFDVNVLQELLGDMYAVTSVIIEPCELGWP
eukprot:8156014-Pyramimonas_sp.AAC.1